MTLSLAAFRYRNVLAVNGGPVEKIEAGEFIVAGRRLIQANAHLVPGLTARRAFVVYGHADGTGTHATASIARHIAISEALERWAFHATVRSPRAAEFGFDVDPTSNGLSAYPGLFARQARRSARFEALERYALMAWWEGLLPGVRRETRWPGISAVEIAAAPGAVTAILFAHQTGSGHAYGHAAGPSFPSACERALIELARHQWLLRRRALSLRAGCGQEPRHIFERRCLFFASDAGHAKFLRRLDRRVAPPPPPLRVVCDRALKGPWSRYASVWRYALHPPSPAFRHEGEDFFLW